MASSDVVKKPPNRAESAAGRAGRATTALGGVRRTTLLAVLAAVVLSFNLAAGTTPSEDRPASFSEIARADARASAAGLSRLAREFSGNPAESAAPRDTQTQVTQAQAAQTQVAQTLAAEITAQAGILAEQSALLASPERLPEGIPAFTLPSPEAHAGAAEEYVAALSDSARASLDAAMRADDGTARLLASTGAAQQVLAVRAAGAAGLPAPEAWTPPRAPQPGADRDSDPASDGSCPGEQDVTVPAQAQGGPDAAGALQGAVDAEYGAAYAYEVAMARTPEPAGRSSLREARNGHLAAGALAVQLLPQLCLPALTPAPAYSLPSSFALDPASALAALEGSLPGVYADLAALGTGSVRALAAQRLVQVSADLYADTAAADIFAESGSGVSAFPVPAAPGLDAEPAALPRLPASPGR
ncbi:DUF4439 domain-containing protein [Arthrobacter sp. NPDC097144]|uniref:DUF4439 domain-containing protein n=1 Tax=Arthrobacter sp. NPDC097144 TaxID=3363946 RepID=UPI0037F5742D